MTAPVASGGPMEGEWCTFGYSGKKCGKLQ
jgi:hypothetical protein